MKKPTDTLLFRAIFLFAILIAQILIVITIFAFLQERFVYFYSISIIISLFILLFLLGSNDMNPSYKISWVIPIMAFPAFGWVFYILFTSDRVSRVFNKKSKAYYTEYLKRISLMVGENKTKGNLSELTTDDKNAMRNAKYLVTYGEAELFKNYNAKYFDIGEKYYVSLLEELEKAEKFIFMEYFIIHEGKMWNSILEILKRKAQQGVDVRVIYDDMGSLLTLPRGYDKTLEQYGIKCTVFNPVNIVFSVLYNNRTHRKITIIDGKVAFTGGLNLADEYINEVVKFGHWKDSGVCIKGEAVWGFTNMFLNMWSFIRKEEEDILKFKCESFPEYEQAENDGYIIPFNDSPFDKEEVSNTTYINLISIATDYVYITSPYLIIDYEMTHILTDAAKRGVDVRIITPYIPDKKAVLETTRAHYKTLVEGGVKIYEYTPGFIHAKNFVSDDKYAIVGTINLDYRSLYLHFECGAWLYKSKVIYDIKHDFLKTVDKSKLVSLEECKEISFLKKFYRAVLKIFAPLM